MPRKLRVEYAGATYHVMSRGARREDIFLDDVDRQDFIKTLAEACQKTDWQVHAHHTGVSPLSGACGLLARKSSASIKLLCEWSFSPIRF